MSDTKRLPGGQPGNQNAKKKGDLAKRTTIRLRPVDKERIRRCAKARETSLSQVVREAIKELYEKMFPQP